MLLQRSHCQNLTSEPISTWQAYNSRLIWVSDAFLHPSESLEMRSTAQLQQHMHAWRLSLSSEGRCVKGCAQSTHGKLTHYLTVS